MLSSEVFSYYGIHTYYFADEGLSFDNLTYTHGDLF